MVSFSIGYDDLDNPTFLRRTDSAGNVDRTLTVNYDDLSRVIKVDYEDITTTDETKFFYEGDMDDPLVGLVGNRTRMESSLFGTTFYEYDGDSNQLDSRDKAKDHHGTAIPLNYDYDAEGNLSRKYGDMNENEHLFTYDAAGRLKQVVTPSETVKYFYDGDGNRVKIIDGSGTRYFLYSGSRKLLELDGNKTVTAYYVHGADGIVYRKKVPGVTYEYHHKDWLGGTTLITDDNQDVAASYFYNVFGDLRWSLPSGTDNVHTFTGTVFRT